MGANLEPVTARRQQFFQIKDILHVLIPHSVRLKPRVVPTDHPARFNTPYVTIVP